MPNWVRNNLRIKSNGEKTLELLELLKNDKGEMTFSNLLPTPKELMDGTAPNNDLSDDDRALLVSKYGHDNWYSWRLANWGCKWDADESIFYKQGDDWIISFSTPWEPPTEFMKKLSEQFDKITFILQFADECIGSPPLGQCIYKNGNEEYTDPGDKNEQFADAVWSDEWYREN